MRVQHVDAAQLVPILRLLLLQAAHLAALPDQKALVLVDRFANIKRIAAVIRSLDRPVAKGE